MGNQTESERTGTRRAVLVGSETYGLAGCNADVALMAEVLGRRGFSDVQVRTGKDASRAGILDGLERLVAAIAPDDAVVVYYSGHGGRIVRPDFAARKVAGLSVDYQFIVPFDLEQSEADDFRGITSEELTQFQRRLTDAFRSHGAVPNVTTILDCCHSGYMARNIDSRPKSIDVEQTVLRDAKSFRMLGISEHLQKLGREVELSGIVTNPDAVRMVACQPEESAYELASTRGGRHGAMTDALATVLDGLGDAAVPWAVVGDLVRRRVRALQPEQRPEVEGPSERLPFSAASAAASDALAITTIRGVSTVEAGELLGLAVGDELDIVAAADGERVGEATVKELAGGAAVLQVEGAAAAAIADGTAIAVPRNISVPKLFVHIGDVGQGADALRREIERSTRLAVTERPAEAIAGVGPGPAAGSVTLLDAAGAPWRATPFADDAAGRRELVDSLQALAVGHRLLDLSSGTGASSLGPVVDVQFGRIDTSGAAPTHTPLALHGERLKAGDTVHLAVSNTGPEPLFAWIFDVGVSGRSSVLSKAARSGYALGAAGAEDDRFELWGAAGVALYWPPDVPTDADPAERPETFVVLVADRRADLSSLSPPAGAARGAPASALEAMIAEARTGMREAPAAGGTDDALRYRLETVEFFLSPT